MLVIVSLLTLFLLLGIVVAYRRDGTPIDIDAEELRHTAALFVGSPGSGKTDLIRRLIPQLVAIGDSVVVIDLGGTRTALATFEDCVPKEKQFIFHENPEYDGCYFNPVQLPRGVRNLLRLASNITMSVNVSAGLKYGEFWFFLTNLCRMLSVQKTLQRQGKNVTLTEIAAALKLTDSKNFRDAEMIYLAIELLRAFPQLDFDSSMPEEKTINFDRVLEERQHVYAYLCAIGNIAARQIGSTMLSCLLAAAIARTEEGLPKRTVWLIIDEAPLIISSYFATFLANCRKHGIAPILIAQDSSQFEEV